MALVLLTFGYGIGCVIGCLLVSIFRIGDAIAVFGFGLAFYILSLIALICLFAAFERDGFGMALLSHETALLMTSLVKGLENNKSFTDIFDLAFHLNLFTSPFIVGIVIANWLIPAIERFFQSKEKAMVKFTDYGKRMVIGQDHVIDTIQKVLIANSKLADLGNPKRNRILASFLFVGPTGVGKTETAKALASWLEDYGYSSLRLDANQFSDRESVWTLLGSPKGYVGSDKPGLLPYAISQNPKQIILIDEIEKADQGFYQFLLQMLDEGYVIERSTGNTYYLKRAIVIITSNLENKRIAEIMEMLKDPIQIDIAVRKTLEDAVISFGSGRTFRITPEFLGRIDAVVPFRSLGFEDLVQIAYRDLRGLGLNVSYETVYELTQKYYPIAREYGVRYFLKKIQEEVLSR